MRALAGEGAPAEDLGLQLVFQNPYSSLNPRRASRSDRRGDATRPRGDPRRAPQHGAGTCSASSVSPPRRRAGSRTSSAAASASGSRWPGRSRREPSVIVLDEPLSALDVSVQAQVANLLRALADELGVGMLLISHDLAIVHHVADRTAVMYLGRMVETAPTSELWSRPLHPYSEALIGAIPTTDRRPVAGGARGRGSRSRPPAVRAAASIRAASTRWTSAAPPTRRPSPKVPADRSPAGSPTRPSLLVARNSGPGEGLLGAVTSVTLVIDES